MWELILQLFVGVMLMLISGIGALMMFNIKGIKKDIEDLREKKVEKDLCQQTHQSLMDLLAEKFENLNEKMVDLKDAVVNGS